MSRKRFFLVVAAAVVAMVASGRSTTIPPYIDIWCSRDYMHINLTSDTITHMNGTGGEKCATSEKSNGVLSLSFTVGENSDPEGCYTIREVVNDTTVYYALLDSDNRGPDPSNFIVTEMWVAVRCVCRYLDTYTHTVQLEQPLQLHTSPPETEVSHPDLSHTVVDMMFLGSTQEEITEASASERVTVRTQFNKLDTAYQFLYIHECSFSSTSDFSDSYLFIENGCSLYNDLLFDHPVRATDTPNRVDISMLVFSVQGSSAIYISCAVRLCELEDECAMRECTAPRSKSITMSKSSRMSSDDVSSADVFSADVSSADVSNETSHSEGLLVRPITRPTLDPGQGSGLEIEGDVKQILIPQLYGEDAAWNHQVVEYCDTSNNEEFLNDSSSYLHTRHIYTRGCLVAVDAVDDSHTYLHNGPGLDLLYTRDLPYLITYLRCRVRVCVNRETCEGICPLKDPVWSVVETADSLLVDYIEGSVRTGDEGVGGGGCEADHLCLHLHHVYMIGGLVLLALLTLTTIIIVFAIRSRRLTTPPTQPTHNKHLLAYPGSPASSTGSLVPSPSPPSTPLSSPPQSPPSSTDSTPQASVRIPRVARVARGGRGRVV